MNMEMLWQNFFNTSTLAVLDSNTAGAAYLFDRRPTRKYISVGYANDLTQTTIKVAFDSTQTVSRVILQNVNWKEFRVFYNGTTASTLALTTTCGTTASYWTGNSETSLYLMFTDTAMTSLSIDIKKTIVADEEKKCGQLIISDQQFQFTRNPDKGGLTPEMRPKEITHTMSDGGTVVFRIRDKIQYALSGTHRLSSEITGLRAVYDTKLPLVFVPFPTGTSWDGQAYEMNWVGGFNVGLKPSDNYTEVGYDFRINLEESPS